MNENAQRLIEFLFGGLPPAPAHVQTRLLHRHSPPVLDDVGAHPIVQIGAITQTYDVEIVTSRVAKPSPPGGPERRNPAAQKCRFSLEVLRKSGAENPRAVVICGDACWPNISDEIQIEFLNANIALAWFNRCQIAPDRPYSPQDNQRDAPIYESNPDAKFGAISAWAWGYHRVADVLEQQFPDVPLIFSGHSRGGKAALLAGATDARAWLTHANNAGALGSAPLNGPNDGAETVGDLVRAFPHWVGSRLREIAEIPTAQKKANFSNLEFTTVETPIKPLVKTGRFSEQDLAKFPFEMDDLLAEIAPRGLLITQADGDAWANPIGTSKIAQNLRRSFPNVMLETRPGGHAITAHDWRTVKKHILAALQR